MLTSTQDEKSSSKPAPDTTSVVQFFLNHPKELPACIAPKRPEKKIDDDFHIVQTNKPPKNKFYDEYNFGAKNDLGTRTFHKVCCVEKKKDLSTKKLKIYKPNSEKIPNLDDRKTMAYLEPISSEYAKFLAGKHIVGALRTVLSSQTGEPVGTLSKMVADFEPVKNTKLDKLRKILKNPEVKKRLAIGLMTRFLLEEDDLHIGNMSPNGFQIDYDDTLFPIVRGLKGDRTADIITGRNPATAFKVTANDLRHFPNIKDAMPHYFPTVCRDVPGQRAVEEILEKYTLFSKNAFSPEENALYAALETDPDFIYYKHRTLLKFLLTNKENYYHLAQLHAGKEQKIKDKNMLDELKNHMGARIEEVRAAVVPMEEFYEFLKQNGQRAFDEIQAEFKAHNQEYEHKIHKKRNNLDLKNHPESLKEIVDIYQSNMIDLNNIKKAYVDLRDEIAEEKSFVALVTEEDSKMKTFLKTLEMPDLTDPSDRLEQAVIHSIIQRGP